jgi:hypothetical protein
MDVLKKLMIAVGWMLVGTVIAVLIGSLPAALDVVDDFRWGRVIGNLLLPTLATLAVAGMLFANAKRLAAILITAVVLFGYCALAVYAFTKANG